MINYLYAMSDIYLFILLGIISILISISAMCLIKRFVSIQLRNNNNAVIGYIAQFLNIIYGVLAGLMALYLINNVNYIADSVQREANAVADLYRESRALKEPYKSQLQQEIKNYLAKVIQEEWPTMQAGNNLTDGGDRIINKMSDQLITYHVTDGIGTVVLQNILTDIKVLYDTRQQRIYMGYSGLNPAIWIVILLGTILTIGINFLFGMNFYLHLITVSAAALMASSIIFLLISLEKPFQGDFVIGPNSFQTLLTFIENTEKNTPQPTH